ncbi:MAG: MBL fold metallo-hydrolase [Akkermansiaceae bacterium]|jgi:glyoxylase-like metal-dependent hydrolase (beta-lactamase superfamily II)|nr:MBL fold metallo-hydrolase [Akkermansiaceae bacterium]
MIPRYDSAPDVVRKALRGHDLAPVSAAGLAGIDASALNAWLAGKGQAPPLSVLARVLGLDPEALVSLDSAFSPPVLPPGIRQIVLPFGEDTVNAWWIESAGASLLIDGGPDPRALSAELGGKRPGMFLVTHPHPDHIGGLLDFGNSGETLLDGSSIPSDGLPFGTGTLHARPLPGHHPQGWGYVFRDPRNEPLWAALGDALFMGSMGGCPNATAFQQACRSLSALLDELSPGTFLLTGHGPATTVEAERKGNAFAPSWRI